MKKALAMNPCIPIDVKSAIEQCFQLIFIDNTYLKRLFKYVHKVHVKKRNNIHTPHEKIHIKTFIFKSIMFVTLCKVRYDGNYTAFV